MTTDNQRVATSDKNGSAWWKVGILERFSHFECSPVCVSACNKKNASTNLDFLHGECPCRASHTPDQCHHITRGQNFPEPSPSPVPVSISHVRCTVPMMHRRDILAQSVSTPSHAPHRALIHASHSYMPYRCAPFFFSPGLLCGVRSYLKKRRCHRLCLFDPGQSLLPWIIKVKLDRLAVQKAPKSCVVDPRLDLPLRISRAARIPG